MLSMMGVMVLSVVDKSRRGGDGDVVRIPRVDSQKL